MIAVVFMIMIISGALFLPAINSISGRISKTDRVNANVLVVEGWLLPYAIEMAKNEFKNNSYDHLITTGIRISDYFQVSMNGYLIFYTHSRIKETDVSENHTISIDAYSEMEDEDCAHFNVFVNDSLVADFFADKKRRRYEISWEGRLSEIDSVLVQFDNDRFDEFGDRNLYVKEIILDRRINFHYQYNSEYDVGELDGQRRVNNNFSSHAELARNSLLALGIDSSRIIAVTGRKVRINRTLSSAVAFSEWLKTSGIEVKGINIITRGTHARRTRMTYNKILNANYEIGIISLPDYKENASRKYKVMKTIREIFSLAYYWILLIPY